jgi:ATP-binding cassette subfamily B (MDR/TAP) protein 7
MLLGAARSQCRFARRKLYNSGPSTNLLSFRHPNIRNGRQARIFTTGGSGRWKNKDGTGSQSGQLAGSQEPQKSVKTEKTKSSGDTQPAKKPDMLSETSVANKEQRKADWAIMKEMAKYLWPKVNPRPLVYSKLSC